MKKNENKDLTVFEREFASMGYKLIGGADEVGRGTLAGPVVACVVILPPGYNHAEIDDSKKLSAKKRERLADVIKNDAVAYSICEVSEIEIDKINILKATIKAMTNAFFKLSVKPDFLLTDALTLPEITIPHRAVTGGDSKSITIAAASILAKVYRDNLMCALHEQYPAYGFASNKGYGTAAHIKALKENGACPVHRRSFIRNFSN